MNKNTYSESIGFKNPELNSSQRIFQQPHTRVIGNQLLTSVETGRGQDHFGSPAFTLKDDTFSKQRAVPKAKSDQKFKGRSQGDLKAELNQYDCFDLNDVGLIDVITQETRKIITDAVPDEEEEGIDIRERVKMHSEEPLRASQIAKNKTIESPTRKSAIEGRKSYLGVHWTLEANRNSIRDQGALNARFTNASGPNELFLDRNSERVSQRPSVINYRYKIEKNEYEEDDEDTRGGIFCGICTTRKKLPKKQSYEDKYYVA